jgi:hypothetical protein
MAMDKKLPKCGNDLLCKDSNRKDTNITTIYNQYLIIILFAKDIQNAKERGLGLADHEPTN